MINTSSDKHDLPILYYIIYFMKKTSNILQKVADVMYVNLLRAKLYKYSQSLYFLSSPWLPLDTIDK